MSEVKDTLHILVEYFTGQEEGEDDVGHPYYVASCDTIGLVTDGDTFEDLLANLREALDVCLEDTDTIAEFNVVPNPRVVLQMEMPGNHAKTVDQILRAAEQLTPEEQQELIERLQAIRHKQPCSILDVLPLDNVGPWPEDLSLRREDMYGDDER
jgi:predicted RNase H-like HicB family nuclease